MIVMDDVFEGLVVNDCGVPFDPKEWEGRDPEYCPGCGHYGGCPAPGDESCGDHRCCRP